jgi:hypothetical protein
MLEQGYISDHDLDLFEVVEAAELAMQEIRNFYRNYYSYRFVSRDMVIRLVNPQTVEFIESLNRDFLDVLGDGKVSQTGPFPEESDDPDTLHFHRLSVPFNRRDFGRLRQMINMINSQF